MATDIFEFWSGIRLRGGVHPADDDVLKRVRHHFDLNCIPTPFYGPLKTAPVVLLYLSPGLGERTKREAKTSKARREWRRIRRGMQPLWRSGNPNVPWPSRRTRCFGEWEDLRTKVAFLNISPYHSKTFEDSHLLAALPSCRKTLDWAQSVLFSQAIAGQRVVIAMRSAGFWGLQEGRPYGKALFAPAVVRAGFMRHGEMRERIIETVKAAIG
jgi:hypothetical protein